MSGFLTAVVTTGSGTDTAGGGAAQVLVLPDESRSRELSITVVIRSLTVSTSPLATVVAVVCAGGGGSEVATVVVAGLVVLLLAGAFLPAMSPVTSSALIVAELS